MKIGTVSVILALAIAPSVAHAQGAGTLYRKGVAAMDAGKLAQACPMLEKSYEKEGRLATLFAVAQCKNKQARFSAALEHFRAYLERFELASSAEQKTEAERRKLAGQQVEALEKTLPQLTLLMPPSAPDGTIVKLDGRVAPFLADVRVQPGDHAVTLEVPDLGKVETKVSLAAGENKRVQLTLPSKVGEPAPAEVAPPPAPQSARQEPALPEAPKPPPKPVSHTAAFIAGGVGVAGLAVGTVFGFKAISKAKVVDARCIDALCDGEGKRAGDQGKAFGWVSTGGFALGAIGVGVALYTLLSDSAGAKSASASPRWMPVVAGAERGTGGLVGARGTF